MFPISIPETSTLSWESNLYLTHVVRLGNACVEKAELQISQHLSGLGQRALQLPEQGTGALQDTEREPKLWKDLFLGGFQRIITHEESAF